MIADSLVVANSEPLDRIRTEVLMVDPAMARALRDTCLFERQRDIAASNVQRLAFEMRQGTFVPGSPIFLCVLPDNSMLLVNGNHTMEAVCESGLSLPMTFIYLRVRDAEEAAQVYATFDNHKVRTWLAALKAVGLDQQISLAQHIMSAIGAIMAGFARENSKDPVARSRTARFKKMEEYKNAAEIIAGCIAGVTPGNRRLILRAAVLAVALETARYQPSAAAEFWRAVALDDGLPLSDPRKKLLQYLTKYPAKHPSDRVLHSNAAALAWNAWFEKKPLDLLKPGSVKVFRLAGTPWGVAKAAPAVTLPPAAPRGKKPLFQTGMKVGSNGARPIVHFAG
jgi:hypothetical protein